MKKVEKLKEQIRNNYIRINTYIDEGLISLEKVKIAMWWDQISQWEKEIIDLRNESIKKMLK